jgi:hypothetical protein
LPETLKDEISGIRGLCKDQHGNLVGTEFPVDPSTGYFIQSGIANKEKVWGEKWGFIKTSIMKQVSFHGEVDRYVPENVFWFAINVKYKSISINKVLRTYYINENPNAITAPVQVIFYYGRGHKYSNGSAFYYQEVINKYLIHLQVNLMGAVKIYAKYIKYSILAKTPLLAQIKKLNTPGKRIAAFLMITLVFLAAFTKVHDTKVHV